MRKTRHIFSELKNIDASWTLFLDRDGVINGKIPDDYVRSWAQFRFLPHSRQAIKKLAGFFGRIIVVTNCRGIVRGLLSHADQKNINAKMLAVIRKSEGRIDRIYYCPHDAPDKCSCRKPQIGMALKAKKDFPEINFNKSVIVGDSDSDMEFGRKLAMFTVFLTTSGRPKSRKYIDLVCENLRDFYKYCAKTNVHSHG
ncbi:MAG: HAD-IIIA family hydrolase [Planctomycetes bacterium]|nr:HAD-IIIA family hydrolase [Planctomycetota bacterium]